MGLASLGNRDYLGYSNTTPQDTIAKLKRELGHEPIEPANQYCKHCGVALFTQAVRTPCTGGKE